VKPAVKKMLLVRYFLFTGGILLALLFAADWYFPKPPIETASADIDRSTIRIHSSHSWPAAVRYDTSMPMPHVSPTALAAAGITPPAVSSATTSARQVYAYTAPPPAKPPQKLRRRVHPVPRVASRDTQPRLASTQFNWFSTW
jgi:hypothetical protein